MHITKILTTAGFAVLLTGCMQSQNEGSLPVVAGSNAQHVHNVEGFGDFKHTHDGNNSAEHGHSWQQIQNEIKGGN